jgi:hypothetical protein
MILVSLSACGPEGDDGHGFGSGPAVGRPAFSGEAALELVRTQVEFGPRVPGWEGHRQQLEWMVSLLESRADSVKLQTLEFVTSQGDTLPLTNVLARFNSQAQHRILLLAHWDTRPWSDMSLDPAEEDLPVPGANDGGSGTAILLHLAELMSVDPPPAGVDLLLVDGEDYGPGTEDMFIGSRHFARNLPKPIPWRYGLLLDMVGDRDPSFPVEAYSAEGAPKVVQHVWTVARELGFGAYFPTRVGVRVMDDHLPLLEAGLPTIDIIDFDYEPWHTPRDTPDQVSAVTLRMVGELVTEVVYRGG